MSFSAFYESSRFEGWREVLCALRLKVQGFTALGLIRAKGFGIGKGFLGFEG